MPKLILITLFIFPLITSAQMENDILKGRYLKDAFEGKFYIGTALGTSQITEKNNEDLYTIRQQFNAIVAENCMKSMHLQPVQGRFNFEISDQFVEFGERHNMFISGHTLIWHSQAPKWFFEDHRGKDVSRDTLINRMKEHISTVVNRYKGRVKGWDVVNEAILADGSWRKNKFYEIIGEEYIRLAFEFAHEADPEAELYYNDYSMSSPLKQKKVVELVKILKKNGVRIDGIGMQGHISLRYPDLVEFEKSIVEFARQDVNVMITELDITVLPSPHEKKGANIADKIDYESRMNPYTEKLPDSVESAFNQRYLDLFELLLRHRDKITRVTLWGVNDAQSWRNNWPIRGRKDYPLLFDRESRPKPVVNSLIELGYRY